MKNYMSALQPRNPKHATKLYVAKARPVRSYRGVQEQLFKNQARFAGSEKTPFEAIHRARNTTPQVLRDPTRYDKELYDLELL